MIQPQFSRSRLDALTTLVIDALEESLDWTDVGAAWQTLDVGARMPHLTMNVVSASILGSHTSRARAQAVAREAVVTSEHSFRAMIAHELPSWLPLPGRRRFDRGLAKLHREVRQLIDERRRRADGGDDLLAQLISVTDDETGVGMDDAQLIDETMSLLLAGYDTTSTGLQWCLHLLTRYPEHLARLREECDAVLRGHAPRAEDLQRLHYARWVMQEALRLYPPLWWLPRMAAEDDEIGGHAITKGTIVAPILYAVHRHPDFWSQPECFDPERFDPARAAGRHPLAWVPFGAGPRKCVGQELSLMEATLALAMITQRFELAATTHTVRAQVQTVMRPADGVRLRIRRRPARRRRLDLVAPASASSSRMAR